MTRREGFIGIAAFVIALAPGGTRAQELQLKEADIRNLPEDQRAAGTLAQEPLR